MLHLSKKLYRERKLDIINKQNVRRRKHAKKYKLSSIWKER